MRERLVIRHVCGHHDKNEVRVPSNAVAMSHLPILPRLALEGVDLVEPITLELDAAGFEQVLNNLLDNALRFSPEDEPIIMRARQDGEHVFLEVEDHGVGLDEETAQRVFERFFQGDNSAKRSGSLGLGLYISHKIVEEHNGNISIRSERGERTVVEVSLPLR